MLEIVLPETLVARLQRLETFERFVAKKIAIAVFAYMPMHQDYSFSPNRL